MENFTKGDWQAHKTKVTGQAGLTYVADCYPFQGRMNQPKLQEALANARLISATPDMYGFLKDLARAIDENQERRIGASRRMILDSILAKAEGRIRGNVDSNNR